MKIYYVFSFIKKLFLIIICNNLFYSVVIFNIFEWGMYNFLVVFSFINSLKEIEF